jgi:integrase
MRISMNQYLKYLTGYGSQSTISLHKSVIKSFLKSVYGLEDFDIEQTLDKYFSENRDIKDDITNWMAGFQVKNTPPLSMRTEVSILRTFLSENDIELPQKFWKGVRKRIRGSMARTMDKVPTNTELRKIIMVMPSQGKALFTFLLSSGCRIGETVQLKISDLDLNHDPVVINVRGEYTKTGDPKITFISHEAKEFLEVWLKNKDLVYPKGAKDRVFPFSPQNAELILVNGLKRIDMDKQDSSTHRMLIHCHVFRKYFNTTMKSKGCPEDVVEALLGHKEGVKRIYGKYSIDQLSELYKKAEPFLTVMSDQEELIKLKQEEAQNNGRLGDLFAKYKQLEEKLSKVSTMVDEFEVVLAKMEAK